MVMAVVVLGNAVGLAANVAAAVRRSINASTAWRNVVLQMASAPLFRDTSVLKNEGCLTKGTMNEGWFGTVHMRRDCIRPHSLLQTGAPLCMTTISPRTTAQAGRKLRAKINISASSLCDEFIAWAQSRQ